MTPADRLPRVIVTRPAAQAGPFVQRLRALGLEADALPLIDILPAADPHAVQAAWQALPGCVLAMFVSANAVQHFFAARPEGCGWPAGTQAGSTGPGTTAALRAAGVGADRVVEPADGGPYDTEALWQHLCRRPWAGTRVLIVRGEGGRDWLARQLQGAGAQVDFVAAYRRRAPAWTDAHRALVSRALAEPAGWRWHFSSSESIDHLLQACPGVGAAAARALATHPRIAEHARAAGFGPVALVGVRPDDVVRHLRAEGGGAADTGAPGGAPIESPPL